MFSPQENVAEPVVIFITSKHFGKRICRFGADFQNSAYFHSQFLSLVLSLSQDMNSLILFISKSSVGIYWTKLYFPEKHLSSPIFMSVFKSKGWKFSKTADCIRSHRTFTTMIVNQSPFHYFWNLYLWVPLSLFLCVVNFIKSVSAQLLISRNVIVIITKKNSTRN